MIQFVEDLEHYHPKNTYSEFVQLYFQEIIKNGVSKYISNLDVEIKILEVNNTLIPISFWNADQNNCYTSSLSGNFQYLLVETKNIKNPIARGFVNLFSSWILKIIKQTELDKIIFVNNLLLSTNLYPEISPQDKKEIHDFLLKQYPKYAIIYRSINDFSLNNLDELQSLWYKRIVSRQVFISQEQYLDYYVKKHDMKNDERLLKKCDYFSQVKNNYTKDELLDIKACYDNLYIDKYTDLNPQFTVKYLDNLQRNKFFSLNVLRTENKIKAAYGYYHINGTITTPIFWYKNENLYRHISYLLITQTLIKAKVLNQSSGVWQYKINRGAVQHMEYSLVYYQHLNWNQKIIWNTIYFFSKNMWEKLLKNNVY